MIVLNFSEKGVIKSFGNLFQRLLKVTKPIQNELNKWFELNKCLFESEQKKCLDLVEKFLIWEGNFNLYFEYLNNLISKLNKDLTEKKPWTLELDNQVDILGPIIIDYYLVMCLMYPIIPSKVLELSKYFGWEKISLCSKEIELNIPNDTTKPIAFEYIKINTNDNKQTKLKK